MFNKFTKTDKDWLKEYSDVVRSLAAPFGENDLPATGFIEPSLAKSVLHKIIYMDRKSAKKESGTDKRSLPKNITQLELRGALNVTLKKSDIPSLTVFCSDKEYLSKVTIDIDNDTLSIGMKPLSFTSGKDMINTGTMVFGRSFSCNSISIDASNSIVNNGVDLPELQFKVEVCLPNIESIELEGSGDISFANANESNLSVCVSGSGSVDISGSADTFDATISGSGDITAAELKTKKAKLQVTGSGDIEVFVVNSVDARVTGSGDIIIFGYPPDRKTKVIGSGDIYFE